MPVPEVYLDSAIVIGCLRPGLVDVAVRPDRRDAVDLDGKPTAATEALPIELFPPELRRPNAEVWLVSDYSGGGYYVRVLPRQGYQYPAEYRHLRQD